MEIVEDAMRVLSMNTKEPSRAEQGELVGVHRVKQWTSISGWHRSSMPHETDSTRENPHTSRVLQRSRVLHVIFARHMSVRLLPYACRWKKPMEHIERAMGNTAEQSKTHFRQRWHAKRTLDTNARTRLRHAERTQALQ